MTAAIVAISVIAYLTVGTATAVMVILDDGEPKGDEQWALLLVILFWWIILPTILPIMIARWIKARQAARHEKPKVFSEYDEP
jgi:glucan phosphoethanolaminetransferase (alkaline phosphatase superfamily)